MAKKKTFFSVPLREDWAESLLLAPSQVGKTVSRRLEEARVEMRMAAEEASRVLQTNALAAAVATAAAQEIHKRGEASLFVREDGVVMLHVVPYTRSGGRGWVSDLPTLESLRKRAQKVNLDPTPFGRAKRKLLEAIKEAEAQDKRPRKRFKTAPAIGPVRQVDPSTLLFGGPNSEE